MFAPARITLLSLTFAVIGFSSQTAVAQRGGFDPKEFLSRLDRNGNGQIDPDEQEGPAGFMIQRMQSSDPSIKAGQPIPLTKVSEAFEKMRQERESGGGDFGGRGGRDDRGRDDRGRDDRGGDDRGRDDRGRSNDDVDPMEVPPLVPGFGMEEPIFPLLGFGPSAEIMAVVPIEADFVTAREALGRYDRNKDGQIDQEELRRGPFWGTPMDFDRNGDGKLSETELATRQAVRRGSEESRRGDEKDDRRRNDAQKAEPKLEDFQGRKSYRVYAATTSEGTPRFFADRDLNRDGQISMSEYTSDWSDAIVAEFYNWDSNRDGVITAQEVQAGVNQGYTASDARAGVSPQDEGRREMVSVGSTTSASATTSNAPPAEIEKLQIPTEPPSEKTISLANKIISKYDKNGDLALSATEWGTMMISPAGADFNGDGRITVLEYAQFLTAKSGK